MPDLPDASPEWPHQLRAAGALVLIGVVWLLVLPVAAGAYAGLEIAARIRGGLKPRKPRRCIANRPSNSAPPLIRR